MSYRSIKRVLGESSLERKCRIFFGICLFFLFGVAFYSADRVAERFVRESAHSKARDAIAMALVSKHYKELSSSDDPEYNARGTASLIAARAGIGELEVEVFPLRHSPPRVLMDFESLVDGPTDTEKDLQRKAAGRESIRDLQVKLDDFLAELNATTQEELDQLFQRPGALDTLNSDRVYAAAEEEAGENADGQAEDETNENFTIESPPVDVTSEIAAIQKEFDEIHAENWSRGGEYDFYRVLHVNQTCRACHFPETAQGISMAKEPDAIFYAIRVSLSGRETKAAINSIRAILISIGIVVVFIAALATYVIVRYVIVKPLRHLRDVSDEVSRGNTDLRAELQTGDEFEELAASFNRMLRHLVDTQKELRLVNKDLDANIDELAQLNMQLYEVNQLKGEFLANMSHELRTPLNSIIGFSEVLEGVDSLSDKQRRYASNIRKSGRLLLDMINDILDLAKIDAGKMEVKPSSFRIDAVVGELVDMVRSLANEKNIDMQVVTNPSDPPMYQDQVKIQQVLTNLLSNAIKFTPEGGRITVSALRGVDGRLRLAVQDTGVGIADDDLAVIFEKFRQGKSVLGRDSLTREYSGTGLGLSIVKELCRLLGGEVQVESVVGKGSVFTVVLPWECEEEPVRDSDLSTRLNELTKPKRVDFERAWKAPDPSLLTKTGAGPDSGTASKETNAENQNTNGSDHEGSQASSTDANGDAANAAKPSGGKTKRKKIDEEQGNPTNSEDKEDSMVGLHSDHPRS